MLSKKRLSLLMLAGLVAGLLGCAPSAGVVSVSISGPIKPYVPAGPTVEIVVRNVSQRTIVSLAAEWQVPYGPKTSGTLPIPLEFDVSAANPLGPGQSISRTYTIVGPNGLHDNVAYPFMVKGTFEGGKSFSETPQVTVQPPPT